MKIFAIFGLAIAGFFVATNGHQGDGASRSSPCLNKTGNEEIHLISPPVKDYADTAQLVLPIECKYVSPYDSIRQIDYKTGEPIPEFQQVKGNIIALSARPAPYKEAWHTHRSWHKYPELGKLEFGLSYRPLVVESRPEDHWEAGYFKPNVSGDDFHIRCRPGARGFAILPRERCVMQMALNPTRLFDRSMSVYVTIVFDAHRLSDWRQIEAVGRDFFGTATIQ